MRNWATKEGRAMNVQSKNYGIRLDAERAVPTSLRLEEKELLMPLHHTPLF